MAAPVELDTKGLRCPLPVLKARRALMNLPAGGLLRVFATDPGAIKDFPAFCETAGHHLLRQSEADGVLIFEIKKGQ